MDHIVIPDTQVKKGVPLYHLGWAGRFLVDEYAGRDVRVIHIGDHWDMPSLSSYDRGTKSFEGRRYSEDIEAGNKGFMMLNEPRLEYNLRQKRNKNRIWMPDLHFLDGNHEARITKAIESSAEFDGLLSLDQCDTLDWNRHSFKEPVCLDGVWYSHYWYNKNNGNPITGAIETRLKTIGHTFTQGHQQGLAYGSRPVLDHMQHGLVCGSFYLHEEEYRGPQANFHWRGIVVCHEVNDGDYDIELVSVDRLCKRYEGKSIKQFMGKTWAF